MTTAPLALEREEVPEFASIGVRAFTTTRAAGSFGLGTSEAVSEVMARWTALQLELLPHARRLVLARQVHGTHILTHLGGWEGWLRAGEADGHASGERGLALAVSVADCIPVFIAHHSGHVALLHAGWRGTAGGIMTAGIRALKRFSLAPEELLVHLGPGICGRCYEVDADVRAQLTGETSNRAGNVDLRSVLAAHATDQGVRQISATATCTRCDNAQFFSHRAGDSGRQVAVIVAPLGVPDQLA